MKSDNYYINQRVGIVRIKDLKVPVDYLLFFLQSKTKKILSDAAGAAQPNISPKDIAKYEISIPSEEKMISISKELNLISRTIVLKQNKLLSLDELIKSRFIEMFGDRLINLNKKMSSIATPVIGLTYKPSNVTKDGTIVLRSGNIQNNELQLKEDIVRVSNINISEQKWIKDKDILMCSRNGSARLVGKSCLIRHPEEQMSFGAFMTVVRTKYPYFLQGFFTSDYFKNQLTGVGTASVNQITSGMLNNYDVIEPTEVEEKDFESYVKQIDKSKFVCYSKYFLWLNFTFVSSTIAYSNVVSILEWPNRCWTCSIGIPLSIAFVANVLLNLCGCTLSNPIFLPIFLSIISTPLISSLSYGFKRPTKRASLSSFLEFKYCCKCIFVFASKYTFRCLLPLPKTTHSLFSKSISLISNLTSSPTLIPVDIRTSTIAKSRLLFIDCFINSIVSSEYTSFTTFPVFTLWILLQGLFEI